MNTQPEATRLAVALEAQGFYCDEEAAAEAAAELRRLHALNQELLEALHVIYQWGSHPVNLAVDYGSNGVRDFYRGIARAAIAKATGEQK